jgi:hypothetical protein
MVIQVPRVDIEAAFRVCAEPRLPNAMGQLLNGMRKC